MAHAVCLCGSWQGNVDHLPGHAPSSGFRADMLGSFVWKYSDDGGISWSSTHYLIPVPLRYIDRLNSWKGAVQASNKQRAMLPRTSACPQALLRVPSLFAPLPLAGHPRPTSASGLRRAPPSLPPLPACLLAVSSVCFGLSLE